MSRRHIVLASEYVPVTYDMNPRVYPEPKRTDVDYERKPVLYLSDGCALVRVMGFQP